VTNSRRQSSVGCELSVTVNTHLSRYGGTLCCSRGELRSGRRALNFGGAVFSVAAGLPVWPSVSSGINFAFGVEPVLQLVAADKAAQRCFSVGHIGDALMTLRRGQPVWHQCDRPEQIFPRRNRRRRFRGNGLLGWQSRFLSGDSSTSNFARHDFLLKEGPLQVELFSSSLRAWPKHFHRGSLL
jgi:hypothetical protein